jgi:hypothetical protein
MTTLDGVQLASSCRRSVAGSIGDGENPGGPRVYSNQHSGSLGRGQFVSTAARVAEVDAFEDRNAVLASRLSELALAATARRPRLLADVRPYVRCHRVTVRRSTGARGDRSAEGTYVA